jgi:hypothetical protein
LRLHGLVIIAAAFLQTVIDAGGWSFEHNRQTQFTIHIDELRHALGEVARPVTQLHFVFDQQRVGDLNRNLPVGAVTVFV